MKFKRFFLPDLVFLIVILVLALLSIFSYQRIVNLNKQSGWINHTNLVKLKLEQTLSHIRDVQTGNLFFLLTTDSSYLIPYHEAIRKNQENLDQIELLTSDNKEQQSNAKMLRLLSIKSLQWLHGMIKLPGEETDQRNILLSGRKNNLDEVSIKIKDMIQTEDQLLAERHRKKNRIAYITPLFSLLLSVFSIIAVALGYFVLRSETRLRYHAEDHIKKLNEYFKDLPALFAIVKDTGHVHELSNTFYNELSGNRLLAGKTYREAFPELAGQGFFELLDKVNSTGERYIGKEIPLMLNRGTGHLIKGYFNFVLQPVLNDQRQPEGILIFGYEITEMITARKKVEETEQRSRLAIEAANIGTFDWDMENKQFTSSTRLMEVFGFTGNEKEVTHQDLINRFHPADKPVRDKAVDDSIAKGSLSYEARVIWPDKSVHWISVYGKIIQHHHNETRRMYGTAIDITEQKMALEELKESEAKFRLLADSMPQFVWTGDKQGKLNYFNQAVYEYSGLTADDIQKDGWISIVHPDDREDNIKKWMHSIATGEEFIFEHRFRNAAGYYRWQLSRALPQMENKGEIQRWVGTSTDIDDQKNLSNKLEQQVNERTQELVNLNKHLLIKNNIFAQAEENALIGSYSWNLQSGEMEYSDNLFRLFGYEPNEFIPSFEKYHSMIHPEDEEQVMKDGIETMQTKKLAAHTYRVITKNGTIKHFRSTGKIIGEQENTMLIGTVQDISQDTMLNEILRIKNLELERSNAELESFNYIASHDLQEPLRKIQAFSQRIIQKESNNLSAPGRDFFSRINASAARMQNLINALLSYSRADGALNEAEPVDLNILLKNVLTDLQEIIVEKNAVIEFVILPTIYAIHIQVHQLFINLLSNALKYSSAGLAPYIAIGASVVKGNEISDPAANSKINYWKITVADNGIGFEQEYEHKIFELFQRLHSKNYYTGTGIGLAICKKIVRNHQGFISATGTPGFGSTFTIYFPNVNFGNNQSLHLI